MSAPPTITPGRERAVEQITDALQPLAARNTPDNLLVHGPTGMGKTSIINHVFDHLEQETRVKPVYINCWHYDTRSSLLSQLLIQVGYPAPRQGKPVDELFAHFREWLTKNQCVAIALDEFDRLRDQAEVVYDLHQLNQISENKVGIVLISNQPPAEIQLTPRSESRLDYRTVSFRPYMKADLVEILQAHVADRFQPNSVTEDALGAIAEEVAVENGDCRIALNIVNRAGRIAEQEGSSQVTTIHVDQAMSIVRG